jgi:uncharacterized membrane protein (DUF485 family)
MTGFIPVIHALRRCVIGYAKSWMAATRAAMTRGMVKGAVRLWLVSFVIASAREETQLMYVSGT